MTARLQVAITAEHGDRKEIGSEAEVTASMFSLYHPVKDPPEGARSSFGGQVSQNRDKGFPAVRGELVSNIPEHLHEELCGLTDIRAPLVVREVVLNGGAGQLLDEKVQLGEDNNEVGVLKPPGFVEVVK